MTVESKKIGIMVKKAESLFSNGCIQQAYFLYKTLSLTGFPVEMISPNSNYTEFEMTQVPIQPIDVFSDMSRYGMILFSSAVVNDDLFLERCKQQNVYLVNLICGNLQTLMSEEYVFNVHHILMNSVNKYFDLHWILPMYTHSKSFIELLTDIPAVITPYSWDPTFIEKYIHQQGKQVSIKDSTKVNLYIFEPNMSIHKNSLIPILLAEKYYQTYPDKLHKVFHVCADGVLEHNKEFFQHLEIVKHNKLETYPRMIMPYVIVNIQEKHPYIPIVLSHNYQNELNFIHLELFFLGIPIFHNCRPYLKNGMYYSDSENMVEQVVHRIEDVRLTFLQQQAEYMNLGGEIITMFHSENQENVDIYKKFLTEIYQSYIKPVTTFSLLQNIVPYRNNVCQYVHPNDSENIILYHACKHISLERDSIHEEQKRSIEWLALFLNSLQKVHNTTRVCVVVSSTITAHEAFQNLKTETTYLFPVTFLYTSDASLSRDMVQPFVLSHIMEKIEDVHIRPKHVLYCKPGTILLTNPAVHFNLLQSYPDHVHTWFWKSGHLISHHDETERIALQAMFVNMYQKAPGQEELVLVHDNMCMFKYTVECKEYLQAMHTFYTLRTQSLYQRTTTIQDIQWLHASMLITSDKNKDVSTYMIGNDNPCILMDSSGENIYGSIHYAHEVATHVVMCIYERSVQAHLVIGCREDHEPWGTMVGQNLTLFKGNLTVKQVDELHSLLLR